MKRNVVATWFYACLALIPVGAALGQVSTLELRLTSEGKPVAARLYITGAGGRAQAVPGAVVFSRRSEEHSVVESAVRMPLSPGVYRVRAEKGPEFAIVEQKIDLRPGQTSRVEMDIRRIAHMNDEGWYSGDLHIHRDPTEVRLILRAEELNIGPVITRHVGAQRKPLQSYPETNILPVDDWHVVGQQAQEVERNFQGHGAVILLNAPHAIDDNLATLFPTVADLCRQAKAAGAFIDAEKPIWKHVPIGLAFGLIDSIGVVNNHFHPHEVTLDAERIGTIVRDKPAYLSVTGFAHWMMDLYYSYLNCGFRLAASAGSASGVMPSWPGYERVYVHLSGPFSYPQWFQDLKSGRSVATNGPLLRVTAEGRHPGSEVEWKQGTQVGLNVQIDSQHELDRVEVVFNGKVIKTSAISRQRSYRSMLTVPVSEPGWIAVRCFEPVGETLRYAQSSPFYFTRAGKLPVHVKDARRWAEFAHGLTEDTAPELFRSREEYKQAMDEYRQAESIYRKLAAQAWQ